MHEFIFSTLLRKMKAYPVCTRAQAFIFTVLWSFSRISCQSVEEVWTIREQLVKSKDFRGETKEWMAVFFFFNNMCEKCYQKICRYMCNNSIRQKGKKKTKFIFTISISFELNGMDICEQQKLESLEEKKAVHTSYRHNVRRICKLYTNRRPAGKLTWCEPPRDHLDYRWRDNIQRSSPQNTGLAKTVTTLRLEKFEFRHALEACTLYTSPRS